MIMNKDILIMSHLRRNSRESLTEMSKQIKVPISTIYDKLKIHEKTTIVKYTSLIDFAKLGFNTRAHIALKVEREQREEVIEYLVRHKHVNSVFKINNGFDFMLDVIFKHVKDMEDFLDTLESRYQIKAKQVFYIITDIKREAFLSNPQELTLLDL